MTKGYKRVQITFIWVCRYIMPTTVYNVLIQNMAIKSKNISFIFGKTLSLRNLVMMASLISRFNIYVINLFSVLQKTQIMWHYIHHFILFLCLEKNSS